MRNRKEIQKKLSQVRFRHLKKMVRTGLSRRPCNCAHNVSLGPGNTPSEPNVGVCAYKVAKGQEYDGVCDEKFGGRARAASCPVFQANQDADSIREEFDTFLSQADFGEIAYHFPDMAALLWVLSEHPNDETHDPDNEGLSEDVEEIMPLKTQVFPPVEDLQADDSRSPWYLELLRRFRV